MHRRPVPWVPRGVLQGWAFSYERGTPVIVLIASLELNRAQGLSRSPAQSGPRGGGRERYVLTAYLSESTSSFL